MTKELFIDGVANIGFGGGVVRLDLGCAAGAPEDGKAPAIEVRQRVVMTPQGFLQTMAAMEAMAKKLVELGVLQAKDRKSGLDDQRVTSVNFEN